MFKIQKCVAMPIARAKYPFKHMEVTDSFLVPYINKKETSKTINRVTAAADYWERKLGFKFVARNIPCEKGVRVWRTQ